MQNPGHAAVTRSTTARLPGGDKSSAPDWKDVYRNAGYGWVSETVTAREVRRRESYQQHVLPEVDVLLRVALSLTDQPADAEDLVQDTLLRAWRSSTRSTGATRGRGC